MAAMEFWRIQLRNPLDFLCAVIVLFCPVLIFNLICWIVDVAADEMSPGFATGWILATIPSVFYLWREYPAKQVAWGSLRVICLFAMASAIGACITHVGEVVSDDGTQYLDNAAIEGLLALTFGALARVLKHRIQAAARVNADPAETSQSNA